MPPYDWKKGFDPNPFTNSLESSREINSKGSLTFEGFKFFDDRVILTEMFDTGEQIPDMDKEIIINSAIKSVGKKGKITATKLKNSIKKQIQEYNSRKDIQYVFIASLSINNRFQLNRRYINGCTVTFSPVIHKAFYSGYIEQKKKSNRIIKGDFPSNYIYAKISIKAKSSYQANLKGLNSLDLLRGIWNLGLNKLQPIRYTFMGSSKPINKITLGPIETIHFEYGELATEDFWYQPEYQGPLKIYNSSAQIDSLFRYEKNVRKKIKNHKYKADIENALIRYVEALDLYNFQDTFIRLWGILESLTGRGLYNQQDTVTKTLFHYSMPKEYVRQLLNVLREFRNKAVHIGSNTKHIETLVFMLKQFVEVLLQFHIENHFKFDTLEDATEFFELTQSHEEFNNQMILLKKNMKLLKNLKKFQGWQSPR